MTSEILLGSAVELYAVNNGERRSIPHTGDGIMIDMETGEIEFTIYLADDLSGLSGAFFINEDGELAGPGSYDYLEMEVYHGIDEDDPAAVYYADSPTIDFAEVTFPVDHEPAQAELQLTARDGHGFKSSQ